jgi:Rrf2 family nitric oxide-sensitive transcriptional repressor
MKVVNRLARQGYINTIRGEGGGIKRARSPGEIRIGAVVRETEEDLAAMGCLAETGFCRLRNAVFCAGPSRGDARLHCTLDGYTLADLLAPGARLPPQLALEPEREIR